MRAAQVEYATAERSGSRLRMMVHSVESNLPLIETGSANNAKVASVSETASSQSKDLPLLLSEWIGNSPVVEKLPLDLDPRTNRFSNRYIESFYWKQKALAWQKICWVLIFLGFTYCSMAFLRTWIEIKLICVESASYLFAAIHCIFMAVTYSNRWIMTKHFRLIHGVSCGVFSAAFAIARVDHYARIPSTESLYIIMIFFCLAPGDRRDNTKIALASMGMVFFISMMENDVFLSYRIMLLLALGGYVSIKTAWIIDEKERSSFANKSKMMTYEDYATKNTQRTKNLLSNIYPRPVVNDVIWGRGNALPHYDSSSVMVISVLLGPKNSSGGQHLHEIDPGLALSVIHSQFEKYSIHKVGSVGLRITGVSGLFESINPSAILAAIEIMKQCRTLFREDRIRVSIGVGIGWCRGGFIECSKKNFCIYGEAYNRSMMSLMNAACWECCIDDRVKDICISCGILEESDCVERNAFRPEALNIYKLSYTIEAKTLFKESLIRKEHIESMKNAKSDAFSMEKSDTIAYKTHSSMEKMILDIEMRDDLTSSTRISELEGKKSLHWYSGDFRFADTSLEHSYQLYGKSASTYSLLRSLMLAMLTICLLSGLVDLGFYTQAGREISTQKHFFLLARYAVISPLFVAGTLALKLGVRTRRNQPSNDSPLWHIPTICCVIHLLYLLTRTAFVYTDLEVLEHLSMWDIYFFYAEVLSFGMVMISLTTIPVHSASKFLAIWLAGSLCIVIPLSHNIKIYGTYNLLATVTSRYIVPILILWMSLLGRDYVFRREFVIQQALTQAIKDAQLEEDLAASALLWVLSREAVMGLKSGNINAVQSFESFPVICVSVDVEDWPMEKTSESAIFQDLSALHRLIEALSLAHGMEILHSYECSAIITLQSIIQGSGLTEMDVAKMISFGEQMIDTIKCANWGAHCKAVHVRVALDVSPMLQGVFGKPQFVFDVYGSAVHCCQIICQKGEPNGVVVSFRFQIHIMMFPVFLSYQADEYEI
eukprot:TRINITY_DN9026_c0_g1_i9.p1 TRINITY_DN9026_c0_g1~~TRINITY_DN9026_c0_g1_i9.p1  ORF type:complete len:998 (+),score=154.43 TRINITY_DN9026_c0_g1_i9:70-3063(+)